AFLVKMREKSTLLLRHQGKIHLVECREGGVDDTYLLGNVVVCSKEKVEEHCQKDDDQHEEIEGKQNLGSKFMHRSPQNGIPLRRRSECKGRNPSVFGGSALPGYLQCGYPLRNHSPRRHPGWIP